MLVIEVLSDVLKKYRIVSTGCRATLLRLLFKCKCFIGSRPSNNDHENFSVQVRLWNLGVFSRRQLLYTTHFASHTIIQSRNFFVAQNELGKKVCCYRELSVDDKASTCLAFSPFQFAPNTERPLNDRCSIPR